MEFLLPTAFKTSKGQRTRKKNAIHFDTAAEEAVTSLFTKRFEIEGTFSLPKANTMFTEKAWSIETLQSLKRDLNEIKNRLNDYNLAEWGRHTMQRNKAGEVQWRLKRDIHPEYLTQAWCKLYENVCSFPLVSKESLTSGQLSSVHLCEGPGAFITALNHWLRTNTDHIAWKWLATTLNPHYEGNSPSNMINFDQMILHTPNNWFFGPDNTGNLMDLKNLDALVARAGSNVTLITADGSINCMDTPAEQEEVVSQLHYCETVAALHILEKGGNFLLKIFTMFDQRTVCLMYLLSCCFEKIVVNKPVTSKEGNSEVYVVCLGFAGFDYLAPYIENLRRNYEQFHGGMAMFCRKDIPKRFLQQIIRCCEFFKEHQCEVILGNIRTFRDGGDKDYLDPNIKKIKRMVADRFMTMYQLRPLALEEFEVVGKTKLARTAAGIEFRKRDGSYNSRQERENLDPKERLAVLIADLNSSLELVATNKMEVTIKQEGNLNELCITTGKPYGKIESSRFCAGAILKTYNAILSCANDLGFAEQIPSPEWARSLIGSNLSSFKILHFEYTSAPDSDKLINKICDTLENIETNQSLVLFGYSLLSQLNVGLLYHLAYAFDLLILKASTKLGCIIVLHNITKVQSIRKSFREIVKASSEAKMKNEAILSILPISTLCDSTFHQHIVKMNYWVVKQCSLCIAEKFV